MSEAGAAGAAGGSGQVDGAEEDVGPRRRTARGDGLKPADDDEQEQQAPSDVNVEASKMPSDRQMRRGIALSERVELNRESPTTTNRETTDGENAMLLVASDNQSTMIQVASSQCSSGRSSAGSGSKSGKAGDYPLCGPHPIKITVAILLFLSVWTAIILGAHVHKKVTNMESKLSQRESDLGELQNSFLEMKQNYEREIDALKKAVHELAGGNDPSSESGIINSRAKKIGGRRRSACRSTTGAACVLPFIYEGKEVKRCHSDWKNPRPWCATEVDEQGYYIKGRWGYCDKSTSTKC